MRKAFLDLYFCTVWYYSKTICFIDPRLGISVTQRRKLATCDWHSCYVTNCWGKGTHATRNGYRDGFRKAVDSNKYHVLVILTDIPIINQPTIKNTCWHLPFTWHPRLTIHTGIPVIYRYKVHSSVYLLPISYYEDKLPLHQPTSSHLTQPDICSHLSRKWQFSIYINSNQERALRQQKTLSAHRFSYVTSITIYYQQKDMHNVQTHVMQVHFIYKK